MKNTIKIDKFKKKILIIGANGFLGSNILPFQNDEIINEKNFFFIAADLENTNIRQYPPFYHIDITNSADIVKKISKISPEVIILTAAMSNVDQ
ncbi:MAG: NAD-dependent epimerase/dehydratase family protein, partial [Promethearchaeota archaeon]